MTAIDRLKNLINHDDDCLHFWPNYNSSGTNRKPPENLQWADSDRMLHSKGRSGGSRAEQSWGAEAKALAHGRHSGGWAASLAEGDILWPLSKWNSPLLQLQGDTASLYAAQVHCKGSEIFFLAQRHPLWNFSYKIHQKRRRERQKIYFCMYYNKTKGWIWSLSESAQLLLLLLKLFQWPYWLHKSSVMLLLLRFESILETIFLLFLTFYSQLELKTV